MEIFDRKRIQPTYMHTYMHTDIHAYKSVPHLRVHFPYPNPKELRQRRLDLGLDATAGAIFLCDDADQHRNPTYHSLRDLWQKENNALILGSVKGDDFLPDVPGPECRKCPYLYIHTKIHTFFDTHEKGTTIM